MDKNIKDLIEVSRLFGNNSDYIIAGGGNTSYKNDENIWVKASGTSMADIDENGFVCLDRKKLKILSTKTYSNNTVDRENEVKQDLANAILYPKDKRPSVETSMHEIIQFPFIVHTHPTLVNGLMCAKSAKEKVAQLFGDDVLYIEYTDPGYVLFKAVDNALKEFRAKKQKEPSIIFLENHGVFVGADTVEQINEIYAQIDEKISEFCTIFPEKDVNREGADLQKLIEIISTNTETSKLKNVTIVNSLTDYFLKDKQSFVDASVPFTPDIIVYCKSNYLFIEDEEQFVDAMKKFTETHGYYAKVVALKGKGIVALEENEKSSQIVADVFNDMLKVSYLSKNFDGPSPMTQLQIDFIDNWEVENYRRQVSKGE